MIKCNTNIFGKTSEIAKNALRFLVGEEELQFPLLDIEEACKLLYKRQWKYVEETGRELLTQPFLKDFIKEVGYSLPGNCFSCLFSSIIGKINNEEPCVNCRTLSLDCDNERGLYKTYLVAKNKKYYATIIKNSWK